MKEIYHNLKNYMLTALLVLSSSACGSHGNEQSGTDNSDTPAPSKTSFTQGADISWVSEMEKKGLKFYNHEGIETDCFQLMVCCLPTTGQKTRLTAGREFGHKV